MALASQVRPAEALPARPFAFSYPDCCDEVGHLIVQPPQLRPGVLPAHIHVPFILCSGVKYPKMYADGESKEATTFNCIQRSHQNSSEQIGPVLVTQALLGLYHPITAASLGAIWAIGRS